jgi:cell division septal protein FtsQ
LEKFVATLTERLDNVREEVKEIKRQMEEAARRRSAFLPPIVAAVLSAILVGTISFLIQSYFHQLRQ